MNLDKEILGRMTVMQKNAADMLVNIGILQGLMYSSTKKEEKTPLKVEKPEGGK